MWNMEWRVSSRFPIPHFAITSQGQTEKRDNTMRRRTNIQLGTRQAAQRIALRAGPAPLAFRIPRSNRGVTLVEVLISMGILAIGLLGAAAMFPVGSYFMQKGEISDRGAAIAQAAFADLVARGDLRPNNWQIWDGAEYAPLDQYMRSWMARQSRINEPRFQQDMNASAGFVYIIDPLGTAGALRSGTINRTGLSYAPALIPGDSIENAVDADMDGIWTAFKNGWPVRRLCTNSVLIGEVPSESVAQRIYSSSDDLAFSVDDEDVPTRQRVIGPDTNGDQVPDSAVARQSRGDYSWMAMVAPTQSDAREALALDPSAYYFDVSVIVFYKRPISTIDSSEALVNGNIVSTGTGGGEILLDSAGIDDAFEELKEGQWVLVSGPHPSSTRENPLFFSQWYRVLVIDDEPDGSVVGDIKFGDAERQRRIGLRGPDWPWTKVGSVVRVGLFPGAVAVHTKTMRLETLGAYQ
jgi:prepilin-type N-terminal cleavage/methylation domain-containing protein